MTFRFYYPKLLTNKLYIFEVQNPVILMYPFKFSKYSRAIVTPFQTSFIFIKGYFYLFLKVNFGIKKGIEVQADVKEVQEESLLLLAAHLMKYGYVDLSS